MSNSTQKLKIGFSGKPSGHRWVYVELLKYGPPYPRWIPSFEDLHRILRAIAECEDEKYPPPAKGRQKLIEFLRDAILEREFHPLAVRHNIPERDGDTIVRTNAAPAPIKIPAPKRVSAMSQFRRGVMLDVEPEPPPTHDAPLTDEERWQNDGYVLLGNLDDETL